MTYYFISDKIIEDIKNRDMEAFGYEGNTDNIHIKNEYNISYTFNIIFFRHEYFQTVLTL